MSDKVIEGYLDPSGEGKGNWAADVTPPAATAALEDDVWLALTQAIEAASATEGRIDSPTAVGVRAALAAAGYIIVPADAARAAEANLADSTEMLADLLRDGIVSNSLRRSVDAFVKAQFLAARESGAD